MYDKFQTMVAYYQDCLFLFRYTQVQFKHRNYKKHYKLNSFPPIADS